ATVRVIAVGEGTAQALRTAGVDSHLVAGGSGADLVAQMPTAADGDRVLFPASSAAARTVPEGLRAKGYRVREVTAYRPEPVDPPAAVREGLAAGRFGALVLTSPMIARRAAALGVHDSTPIVSIGGPTSRAVRDAGLAVARQAAETTDAALVAAVREVLAAAASPSPTSARPHRPRCPPRPHRPGGAPMTSPSPPEPPPTGPREPPRPPPTRRALRPPCPRRPHSPDGAPLTPPPQPEHAPPGPIDRPRRLRTRSAMRSLVREHSLRPADLVLPMFVREGGRENRPVSSMPGVEQHTM